MVIALKSKVTVRFCGSSVFSVTINSHVHIDDHLLPRLEQMTTVKLNGVVYFLEMYLKDAYLPPVHKES